MLKIWFEVKNDRPKELTPVKYEYTSEVISNARNKQLYYTIADASGLLGGYKFTAARKMNVTNKLTGAEININGGTFYDGQDFGQMFRMGNPFHYYTLKKYVLFQRFQQVNDNRIIYPLSHQSVKPELPQFLINVKNVADLDEKVKFILEPGTHDVTPELQTGVVNYTKLDVTFNIFDEK
jgi:hypothetical protein